MLITAGRLVTGTGVHTPGWVEVEAGLVVAVGGGTPPCPLDPSRGDVDLRAATVVPGFVDIHSHGGGSGAFTDATPESTQAAVDLHRRHGTTSLIASTVAAHPDALLHQVGVLGEQVQDGLIAGIHLEGPWLSPNRLGAHELAALRDPDAAEIDRVFDAARGGIRMVTIAPELPGALDAIHHFVDRGAVAAVGHTDATYATVASAIEAGARVATHLFNAMRPIHHREPGPAVALMEDPRVTVELILDGSHLDPALYRFVMGAVGPDRVALVTDAMAAAGMADGEYSLGSLSVEVAEGVARVAGTDTIAGSTAAMDQVFRNAVRHSGLSRSEALAVAVRQTSVNPAKALGLPQVGLAKGGVADLVVLDDALHVQRVLHRGRWVEGVGT